MTELPEHIYVLMIGNLYYGEPASSHAIAELTVFPTMEMACAFRDATQPFNDSALQIVKRRFRTVYADVVNMDEKSTLLVATDLGANGEVKNAEKVYDPTETLH